MRILFLVEAANSKDNENCRGLWNSRNKSCVENGRAWEQLYQTLTPLLFHSFGVFLPWRSFFHALSPFVSPVRRHIYGVFIFFSLPLNRLTGFAQPSRSFLVTRDSGARRFFPGRKYAMMGYACPANRHSRISPYIFICITYMYSFVLT